MPELDQQTLNQVLDSAKSNDEAVEALDQIAARKCGHCAACCTHLGIQELKKHQGQTCVNLKNGDPEKRCGIYDLRPAQCSDYLCMWRVGFTTDDMRPDLCGFIMSVHPDEKNPQDPDAGIWVLSIFDPSKAGALKPGSKLFDTIQRITASGKPTDIRLHFARDKKVIHFDRDGQIYAGRSLKNAPGDYHNLAFTHDELMGRYETEPKI